MRRPTAAEWESIIQDWDRETTQTAKAFCAERNISWASFGYWRSKVKKGALSKPVMKLLPVTLTPTRASKPRNEWLEWTTSDGARLRFSEGVDVEYVKAVLNGLG